MIRPFKIIVGLPIALTVALLAPLALLPAYAENIDTDPSANELQQRVEATALAYDEAITAVQAAEQALNENEGRIAELQTLIPAQQERSDEAARELYKLQRQAPNIVDLLLNSDDFFSFLNTLEYIDRVSSANVAEIARLNDLKDELGEKQLQLVQARRDAETVAADAETALEAAKTARIEAQRQAQEAARQSSEANSAARSAAEGDSTTAETTNPTASEPTEPSQPAAINDGADWSSDEEAFVNSWAARIDAYLAGSDLDGQGHTFAQAAWNYGVDPRWSPAIAFTESTLGAYCFLPHNAWGWGSVSWGSWEEAIDAHVRGLARGYGYTISEEAAQKYCPPTWQSWYATTLGQMNQI